MRENRLYGSEGGGTGYSTGPSYPYRESRNPSLRAAKPRGNLVVRSSRKDEIAASPGRAPRDDDKGGAGVGMRNARISWAGTPP
jgi:hypothetical protein